MYFYNKVSGTEIYRKEVHIMEYASNAKGNLGVTLGAIGTGLGVLSGGAGLLGMNPMMNGYAYSENDRPISRYELNLVKESMAKDSEIALLKSEQNTEVKIADVYERLITRINADRNAQQEVNAAQAVYNATNGAAVATITSQVAQLMSLIKLVVPADNVCPKPMPQYNSWTAPTT